MEISDSVKGTRSSQRAPVCDDANESERGSDRASEWSGTSRMS